MSPKSRDDVLRKERKTDRNAFSNRLLIRPKMWAGGSLAVVVLVQVWVVSAGWMTRWPTYTSNYSQLADAFLHGQTSLRLEPSASLLALANPYDPAANANLHPVDLSLFHGKFYAYWGPVPAILEMPAIAIAGVPIGDQYIAFAFVFGVVLVSAKLMLEIRSAFFPEAPSWTLAMGILVAGLGIPMPSLLAPASVYQGAIAAGQFFLLAGIYFAMKAFAPDGRRKRLIALAGACWALAMGCRASLVLAVFSLTLFVVWRLLRARSKGTENPSGPDLAGLAALGTPLAIGAFLLAAYNHARFEHWYQFGQIYQLGGADLQRLHEHLFALANVPPNLYAYLIKPPALLMRFPFIKAVGGAWTFPNFVPLPPNYQALEPVVGIGWCLPFAMLALLPVDAVIRRLVRAGRSEPVLLRDPGRHREAGWVAQMLVWTALLGVTPTLLIFSVTMRYLADFTPSLVILAVLGLWEGLARWPGARRRLLLGATLLGAYSIAIGVLLSLTGYYRHFHRYHPGYLGL